MARGAVIYVNAYSVSRHFGGPEEGGWWYDAGEPLASVPLLNPVKASICKHCGLSIRPDRHLQAWEDEQGDCCSAATEHQPVEPVTLGEVTDWYAEQDKLIETERTRLTSVLGWTSRYNRYSVLGGDDFEVRTQNHPAKPFPETRPHYE